MASKLKARITRLEQQRTAKQGTNHVVCYNPNIPGSWEAAILNATPPYMVIIDYGTDEEWEKAAFEQQQRLQTDALK